MPYQIAWLNRRLYGSRIHTAAAYPVGLSVKWDHSRFPSRYAIEFLLICIIFSSELNPAKNSII